MAKMTLDQLRALRAQKQEELESGLSKARTSR